MNYIVIFLAHDAVSKSSLEVKWKTYTLYKYFKGFLKIPK